MMSLRTALYDSASALRFLAFSDSLARLVDVRLCSCSWRIIRVIIRLINYTIIIIINYMELIESSISLFIDPWTEK